MKIKDLVSIIITQVLEGNPIIDIHLTPAQIHDLQHDLRFQDLDKAIDRTTQEVKKEFPDAIDLTSHEE